MVKTSRKLGRRVNAIVLFLRLFGAHLLLLVAGLAVFVLSRPLWSGLIKSTWGRVAESIAVQISPEPTALYSLLAFFAPFCMESILLLTSRRSSAFLAGPKAPPFFPPAPV